ncbi:MAG: energy-coupling factor transporter transmembrane protein EcfT [Actinobacteria bacterium]|nr:energy-coupling factor transporter transmembrane protein EcfT [Actinomycetota bacterium]
MRDFNRIKLGQHYPMDSPIHDLDARVKIACALSLIVGAFIADNAAGVTLLLLFTLSIVYAAKLPPLQVLAALRSVFVLLLITAIAQLLFSPGRVLWEWGPIDITNTGVQNGILYSLRLAMAVILMCVLTMTTNAVELLVGLESLMSPLRLVRFPVQETAMILTTALRFLPVLLSRSGEIARVQEARGADFSSGRLLRRARSLLPLFVPLFTSCFRDAEELGTALASRGYRGGKERTRYRISRFGLADLVALIATAAVMALAIWSPV